MIFKLKNLATVIALAGTTTVGANDLAKMASEVEQFSDAICGRLEIVGSSEKIQIQGETEAGLKLLTKKLANIGFEGAVDFISDEYIGVLQRDLASDRSGIRDCRLKVWADLRGLVSLANNHSAPSDEKPSLSERFDLPMEIRVSKTRGINILDGEVKLHLARIQVAARKKRSTIQVEIPNRPKQTMTLSIDNSSYPVVGEFDYRDSVFEVEIVHQNIEDQIATVRINELK